MVGRTWRTSIPLFMRINVIAAEGLAPKRSWPRNQSRSAESEARLGATRPHPFFPGAPGMVEIGEDYLSLGFCLDPGGEFLDCPIEDEGAAALGIGRCEQRRSDPPSEMPYIAASLGTDDVHDRTDIVHPLFECWVVEFAVAQASSALVKNNHARERSEPIEVARNMRLRQVVFQVRYEAGNAHQINRTVAEYLVCDMNLTAFGITGFGTHNSPLVTPQIAL